MQEIKTESITEKVSQLENTVTDLQREVSRLKAAVFCNSPAKAAKMQRIAELAELNQEVTVSVIKHEFKLRSSNYARELMQEAATAHKLIFFKGQPGMESYVTKHEVQNKAMHAYAEVYRELQDKPVGTEITEGAIAHRYELNGQELQSVIGHLARHNELHVVLPMNRKGIRRVKRVR